MSSSAVAQRAPIQDEHTGAESEVPSDEALQDLMEKAARQWCTPKGEVDGSWQEFCEMEKPGVDFGKGIATAKFQYMECDEVLQSPDRATVIYDLKSREVKVKLGVYH
eukprot:TRINITY_DN79542_c0_g1_i1.p2 TRINITY_DN79542_c0_g1~~TRINITY_DN79542_c0_g1_i1.p2  ORF type:complete len:108 (-),score=31.10 TRINITY_DN79542_c0_g1_i1:258-581(-)